jgi:hypothetical protein
MTGVAFLGARRTVVMLGGGGTGAGAGDLLLEMGFEINGDG